MKSFKYLLLFLLLFLYKCNSLNKEKSIPLNESGQNQDSIFEEKSIEKEIPSETNTKPGLFFLTDLIGKYPSRERVFTNTILSARLKNIKGFNYENFIHFWNVETPISMVEEIIHSSGCKKSDCPSNGYELFIDLKNDNINIFYFRENTLKVYTEKDWIDLPKIFEDELDIKKANAKIGGVDDSESTYDISPLSYSPHNSNEDTAAKISSYLKNILKDDLKLMTPDQREFQYEEVDLNGDNKKEYLVGFKNSYFCGSGGCTFYLLQNDGSVVTIFTVSDAPFIALFSTTKGWKDLLVKSDGSLRLLLFDGKTYPNNPSVSPKFTEIPSDDAYRLLWDQFPIPTFNF